MNAKTNLEDVYALSEEVVAREIQGEFIIIPITSGAVDEEDALLTLNETGKALWNKLDGIKSLNKIASELFLEFEGLEEDISKDVLGLTEELLKRKMLAKV